ncbi:MAG: cytochrome c oxidase subunit II, partial [Candidatus Krumholzibacteriota bacterium]
SFKGLFGKTENVVTDGVVREITVDEEYIRKSILEPNADLVEGYQALMPPQRDLLTDEEIEAIIEVIKEL